MSNALVPWEAEKLYQCEAVIEQGLRTFVDVGNALLEIRNKRLYRAEYKTWEDYCLERWGFTQQHAGRLIRGAKAITNLAKTEPTGSVLPKSETQIRPLTRLEPEQQQEAWTQVIKENPDGKITGAKVQEIVKRLIEIPGTEDYPDEEEDERQGCSDCQHGTEDSTDPEQYWCSLLQRTVQPWGYIWCDMRDWKPEETLEQASKPHVSHSSGNNEWYTPSKYIAAAYDVMGSIDLDPASSGLANETVKAETYYTAEDDGLAQEWAGRVWMNPPYASGLIEQFAEKLAKHVNAGDMTEACVLVNNATETGWFNALLDVTSCVCLIRSRVKFIDVDGRPSGAPLQGQVILYIGENEVSFDAAFSKFGRILYTRQDPASGQSGTTEGF